MCSACELFAPHIDPEYNTKNTGCQHLLVSTKQKINRRRIVWEMDNETDRGQCNNIFILLYSNCMDTLGLFVVFFFANNNTFSAYALRMRMTTIHFCFFFCCFFCCCCTQQHFCPLHYSYAANELGVGLQFSAIKQ